jgi:hypothetical protein
VDRYKSRIKHEHNPSSCQPADFLFNPGSIGVAYSHEQQTDEHFRLDPWAEYAILTATPAAIGLEFRRVPFAVAPLIAILQQSGRPHVDRIIREYGG